MSYPIGFTGSRRGMTDKQRLALCHRLRSLRGRVGIQLAYHGACIGADAEFHRMVLEEAPEMRLILLPGPSAKMRNWSLNETAWQVRKPAPFLSRNREIVESCDLLFAAPASMSDQRGGTWYTIRKANELGRSVVVLER